MRKLRFTALGSAIVLVLGLAACGDADRAPLSGSIHVASSSTVAPLTEAMAKRFMAENPKVRITVDAPGTDRAFTKLCRGETDLSDSPERIGRRAIVACEDSGVAWGEVAVANGATILVVGPGNPIRCLTTEQLAQIWHGNSEVTNGWNQIDDLDPSYDYGFTAWGPGTDTETFASFTKAVNGVEGMTRDYNNTLHRYRYTIQGVAEEPGTLGYVDYSLYEQSTDSVRALAVDSGDGCIAPSPATIAAGTFRPFSHRLFLYPSAKALARPTMDAFLRFYLDNVETVAPRAGFVALTDGQLDESKASLERLIAAQASP